MLCPIGQSNEKPPLQALAKWWEYVTDTECRYCFASEICDLVSVGENGSIIGKTDLEVQKFPEMGKMYYEDDKKYWLRGKTASISMNFRWKMENHSILR